MKAPWLARSLWLLGFACLWLNVADDPPLRSEAYVLDVDAESVTIGLITSAPSRVSVECFDRSGASVGGVLAGEAARRHAMRVPKLLPGVEYEYRVAVDGEVAYRGSVRTAPVDDRAPVRFAFLGDSGDQPWWVWLQRTPVLHWPARWGWFPDSAAVTGIGAAVAGYGPDFVVHLGDVVYPKGQHAHYRSGFFRPFSAALAQAPFWAVLGNHDVMEAGGQQVLANLRVPNPDAVAGGRHFSRAFGPVRILGLDCNSDYSGVHVDARHSALEFVRHQVQHCSEPWIVVAAHFPMRSASRQKDRGELLVALLPELQANAVSIYMSGHDHCYQRFLDAAAPDVPLVSSGGGGKDLYDVRPHKHAKVLVKAFHWGSIEVRGTSLEVRCHGLDGAQLDEFRVPLPAGPRLEDLHSRNPARAARIAKLGG